MMLWLRVGDELGGIEHGLLRAADVSALVEVQALSEEFSKRRAADLDAAHRAAEAVRCQAELDAREAVQAAADEAEALRLEAIEAGRAEGLQAALDQWHARRLDEVLERASSLDRLRELLVELVVSGVERIVGSESKTALFSKALTQVQTLLQGARSATLRIHGSDQAAAQAALEAAGDHAAPISLVIDASLSPGACIFESDWGGVDAGLQTQLQALRAAMQRSVEAARIDAAQVPLEASDDDATDADDQAQIAQAFLED